MHISMQDPKPGSPRAGGVADASLPRSTSGAGSPQQGSPQVVARVEVGPAPQFDDVQFQDCKRQLKTSLLGDEQRDRKNIATLTEEYRRAEQAFSSNSTSVNHMARLLESVRAMAEYITIEDEDIAANKSSAMATLVLKQMQRHALLLQALAEDLRMATPRCSMPLTEMRPHVQALAAWYQEIHTTLQHMSRQGYVSRLFKKKSKEQDALKVYGRALTEHGDILQTAFQPKGQPGSHPTSPTASQSIPHRTATTMLPQAGDSSISTLSLDDVPQSTPASYVHTTPMTLQINPSTNPFADMKSWDSIMRQQSGFGPVDAHVQAQASRAISAPAVPYSPPPITLQVPSSGFKPGVLSPPPGMSAAQPPHATIATNPSPAPCDDLIVF